MFVNENYKRDINYTYKLNRIVFSLLGMWPDAQPKFWLLQKLKKTTLLFVFYFILCCDLISTLLYILLVQKETRARIKIIGLLLFTIVSILKYSNMLYVKNQMKNCMVRIEKDFQSVTSSAARNTMLFHARIGRRLLILCGIFMYGAGMTYRTVIPLSKGKILTAENITIRPLPCPAYYIVFDSQISPAYEIVFLVQCFTGFLRYTITVACCGIAALFTMHIVAQLDILMTLMNNLMIEHELEHNETYFRLTMAFSFLDMVQGVIHFSSFVELMACTSIICLMIYCLIMEWHASNTIAMCSYFILIISFTFNIFVYCFIGEQLSEKGEQVAWTACTLDWHLLPDTKARALILIMIMSNKPMKLKAGNFMELSLRTFGSVVKTVMGYLNLLRSVVD